MREDSPRWEEVRSSQWPHERTGLTHIKALLPDADPYHAWAGVEFVALDGSVNEVDLLVLTPSGLHLVELKHWAGKVSGNGTLWTRTLPDGTKRPADNPLIGANRKARKLGSLLGHYTRKTSGRVGKPFVKASVFLHAPNTASELDEVGRSNVFGLETNPEDGLPGIISGLLTRTPKEPTEAVDRPRGREIVKLVKDAGIRPSVADRKVGPLLLHPKPYAEGPGWQDFLAGHEVETDLVRRVRFYLTSRATAEQRAILQRAAQREFRLLLGVQHPGIARAVDLVDHELGPAVIFEHDDSAVRFDHWLAERQEGLTADQRLGLVRELAEILRYAHSRHLVHRGLNPRSVLVHEPDSRQPRLVVVDWQTGGREASTSGESAELSGTLHLDRLADIEAQAYLAPESLSNPDAPGELLDVFALGAVTYHIFTGNPPAPSATELSARLTEQGGGLELDSALDGVPETLRYLVWEATCGDTRARTSSVGEFLANLDAVWEELTTPDQPPAIDPLEARPGDVLEGNLTVVRRLGSGSTSVALLVKRGEDESPLVLKVARDEEKRQRILDEADVLKPLAHWQIARLDTGPIEVGGRTALLLESAGERTLADQLRTDGRLHLDLLERYGKDLLDIAAYLDAQGVTHRDIKPHNLAARPRPKDRQPHLAIFDFSLARTPADQLHVGTAQYLDPFLGPPRRPTYDPAAERFAVAVTLHEMATGELPVWGDGVANPAQLDCEVTVARDRLDPAISEPLGDFFAKALARDARERFDTVEDMTREWLNAFKTVAPAATAEPVKEHEGSAVSLATPLSETGLTVRAFSAVERFEVSTVGELLELDPMELSRLKGVSQATKREISRRAKEWRKLLSPSAPPAQEAGQRSEEAPARGIETVVRSLVPGSNGRNGTEIRTTRLLLGLRDPETGSMPMRWPSQTDIASALGVTGPRVNQIAAKVRARWLKNEQLREVCDEVVELLDSKGGVMAAHELAEALVAYRGTFVAEPERSTQALGLVRAAVETELERGGDARVDHRRFGEVVLVGREPDDPTGEPAAVYLDYAVKLGRVAQQLAETDPLPPASRVVERLRSVEAPEVMPPLDDTRLVHLAAAASGGAAPSGQLQLYPRGMPADRTLRLVAGSLTLPSGRGLNVDQLRKRVAARFPEAAPLPDRPELDRLLDQAEVPLEWNGEVYVPPARPHRIFSTTTRTPGHGASSEPGSPTRAAVDEVERRLSGSLRAQSFLALLVRPRDLSLARRALLGSYELSEADITRELLAALRSLDGVAWGLVVRSDALEPSHADRRSLEIAVRQEAVPRIEAAIESASGPVLLTEAAPLARYGCMDLFANLADPSVPQPAARWLLLPDEKALPTLDGEPVPVLSDSQWLRLPSAWYAAEEGTRLSSTSPSPSA